MKNYFVEFFHNTQIKKLLWINSLFYIIFLGVSIWKWSKLPSQLPLYYSLPRSSDQLGSTLNILFLPAFSFLFTILNFLLAAFLFTKERLAAIILSSISVALTFLILTTFLKIIFLVS